jgi:hypothetical protein
MMMRGYSFRKIALVLALLPTFASHAQAAGFATLTEMASLRADFAKPEISTNDALIAQYGDANIATIDQSGATVGAGGNYAEINQNGSSNQAYVVQIGDSNRARVNQTGSSNLVDVTQSGTGNTIDLAQNGYANLTTSQIGNNNSIVSSQSNQNGVPATLSEIGNNNSITANLTSPGLSVNISIVGNGVSLVRTN